MSNCRSNPLRLRLVVLAALWTLCLTALAEDKPESKEDSEPIKEKPIRIVPLVTSTPLTGTGIGAAASYLYKLDPESSMSQLQVGGQYSNTESTTLFVRNNAFLKGNNRISNSFISWADTNSDFPGEDGRTVEYNIESLLLGQKLLFQQRKGIYIGGALQYKDIAYSPNNEAGEDFLYENGIVDEQSIGVGAAFSFDTRVNKYYPSNAWWVDVNAFAFPGSLGSINSYYKLVINSRYYLEGFAPADVWANQVYAEFSSDETPDSGLATLSGKSLLRGYPAGQYKSRNMTGAQTEYRYQIIGTQYRLTAFIGAAYLFGGSFGQGDRNRDDDGWYYAAGAGARYAIQSRTGVDLRLDLVTNSDNEQSVYLALNQAF